ncbi:hypothetical protein ACQ86N_01165 [Puia sp. P3]|uniref:hypothetical protein n=1 Tax=Puia sp. P3 TaxID=3423952 RepID=UPI003D667556
MSAELDSLLKIVQWAEQFRVLSLAEPRDRLFYVSVYDFWMDHVAAMLVQLSAQEPSMRHSFKFRYLVARCEENSYIVAAKVGSAEKFADNIRYGNWVHLFRATWYQSVWWMKLCFLLLFVFIGMGMASLGRLLAAAFKKKDEVCIDHSCFVRFAAASAGRL